MVLNCIQVCFFPLIFCEHQFSRELYLFNISEKIRLKSNVIGSKERPREGESFRRKEKGGFTSQDKKKIAKCFIIFGIIQRIMRNLCTHVAV